MDDSTKNVQVNTMALVQPCESRKAKSVELVLFVQNYVYDYEGPPLHQRRERKRGKGQTL